MKLTLCGSLRFEPYWHEANKQLGLAGHICYSVMTFPSVEGDKSWYTPAQKWTLDLAHLAKIEESQGVVMLNIDGYLGESSLRELEWARMRGKLIFWAFSDERRKSPFEHNPDEQWARSLVSDKSGDWIELLDGIEMAPPT
jgi:hypothetical protein